MSHVYKSEIRQREVGMSRKKKRHLCPKCGQTPAQQETRYGIRYACCGMWSWGDHPLADMETHAARKAAHAAFDVVWQQGYMRRGDAYALLQAKMGLCADDCHMKKMNAETARRVPTAANEILAGLGVTPR
jgi:hypothetical protein